MIDYRAFQRGYFARGIHEIQRAGLVMMSRGTVHLLLYRVIDRLLLISADAVHDPLSLAGYLVCNYLLYLRVSGQFHMACGLLHLFGFQLPETHHHYLLATGFTDYWRRINIYWKDFMVRLVFNPVVFRLKRRPQPVALAVATAVVFVVTWLLHAYQSFWLRGIWGFSAPDALFWGILGVLVLINVQLDARRVRGERRPVPVADAVGDPRGPDRRHVRDDRPALVALVESERRGLGGLDPPGPEDLIMRAGAFGIRPSVRHLESCRAAAHREIIAGRPVFGQWSTDHVSFLMDGLASARGRGDAGLAVGAARMGPARVDRLRWALGCDEIENLDRLLSRAERRADGSGLLQPAPRHRPRARPVAADLPGGRRAARGRAEAEPVDRAGRRDDVEHQ